MKQHYHDIYSRKAALYDRLVTCEDARAELARSLAGLCVGGDTTVVETGAGTGRVTRLLASRARRIYAFDRAPTMLAVARARTAQAGMDNIRLAVADHRHLPVRSNVAELAVEGWAFGHLLDAPEGWRHAVGRAVAELERAVRPGGRVVLVETLGTGSEQPSPPSEALARLYEHLRELGFQQRWCRTDYRFASLAEATELVGFFFGAELAAWVQARGLCTVPECTGLWERRVG